LFRYTPGATTAELHLNQMNGRLVVRYQGGVMRRFLGMTFLVSALPLVAIAGPSAPAAKKTGGNRGGLAVITNWGGDNISLIDTEKKQELSKIKVGAKPYDVKVDRAGRFAYVTCSGANFIAKVDLQAMLEQEDARIVVGDSPRDIQLTTDERRAVTANAGTNDVSVVDLVAGKELYRVKLPDASIPYGVGLAEKDRTAVITLWGSGKAVILELGADSGKVVATMDVGVLPYTVAVTPDESYALITSFATDKVFVIDIAARKVVDNIAVGRTPWGLSISPKGDTALVANFYSGEAALLAIQKKPTDPLAAAGAPVSLKASIKMLDPLAAGDTLGKAKNSAYAKDSRMALLTDLAKNQVMILDTETRQVVGVIKVGQAPYGIAYVE
jgi:YVTN family beta-propeller protein